MLNKYLDLLQSGTKENVDLAVEIAKCQGDLQALLNHYRESFKLVGAKSLDNCFYVVCLAKTVDICEKLYGELDLSLFSSIESLSLYGGNLESVILPNSNQIKELRILGSRLKFISLSECKNLRVLNLDDNELKFLDLSDLASLQVAFLSGNNLTEIVLPKNGALLTNLMCSRNKLKSIDISTCPNISHLVTVQNHPSFQIIK